MTISDFEAWLGRQLTRAEHAGAALLGLAETIEIDVKQIEAKSPSVAAAISAGEHWADLRGVPATAIVTDAEAALEEAKKLQAVAQGGQTTGS